MAVSQGSQMTFWMVWFCFVLNLKPFWALQAVGFDLVICDGQSKSSLKSVHAHLPKLSAWHTRHDHDGRAEITSPRSLTAHPAPEFLLGFTCRKSVAVTNNSSVNDEVRKQPRRLSKHCIPHKTLSQGYKSKGR